MSQVFTLDNLYDKSQIAEWLHKVQNATSNGTSKPFANNVEFVNGKVFDPDTASSMFTTIAQHFPKSLVDAGGEEWDIVSAAEHIMFARILPGQDFRLHTDTGCVFEDNGDLRSRYTVLTYLNDDFCGGTTKFYDTDTFAMTHEIVPKAGRTLIFDIDLYHMGSEVTGGGPKCWIGTELVGRRVTSLGQ